MFLLELHKSADMMCGIRVTSDGESDKVYWLRFADLFLSAAPSCISTL